MIADIGLEFVSTVVSSALRTFQTEAGTTVWALPLGDGYIPLIALQ